MYLAAITLSMDSPRQAGAQPPPKQMRTGHQNACEDLRCCPSCLWVTGFLSSSLWCPKQHIIINSLDCTIDFATRH